MELSRTQQAVHMVRSQGITPYQAAKKMGLVPGGVYTALRNEKWIQQGQATQVAPLNDIQPILQAARGVITAWDDNHDDPESFIEALRMAVNEYTKGGA